LKSSIKSLLSPIRSDEAFSRKIPKTAMTGRWRPLTGSVFVDLWPNASPDRVGLKTNFVEHIKSYRTAVLKYSNEVPVFGNSTDKVVDHHHRRHESGQAQRNERQKRILSHLFH